MQLIFALLVSAMAILASAQDNDLVGKYDEGITVNLELGNKISRFPDDRPLNEAQVNQTESGPILTYSLGVRRSGDFLVGSGQFNQYWKLFQPVSLLVDVNTLTRNGELVTYVVINVRQSFSDGFGKVIRGGLNQEVVGIQIGINSSDFVEVEVLVYGYIPELNNKVEE